MLRFLVSLLFFFHTLFADSTQYPFLGIMVSSDTVTLTSDTQKDDQKETLFGLRYGKQTQDFRTVFTLRGNGDYQSIAVEADAFLMDDMFGMPEIRPYLGGTLGYMHYDEETLEQYKENLPADTDTSSDTSEIFYGLNFGFVFYVADNIDLDLSYHYYFIDRLEPLDTMHGVGFALHYFY